MHEPFRQLRLLWLQVTETLILTRLHERGIYWLSGELQRQPRVEASFRHSWIRDGNDIIRIRFLSFPVALLCSLVVGSLLVVAEMAVSTPLSSQDEGQQEGTSPSIHSKNLYVSHCSSLNSSIIVPREVSCPDSGPVSMPAPEPGVSLLLSNPSSERTGKWPPKGNQVPGNHPHFTAQSGH